MNDPRILIIRHAESEWNAVERWQGHGDPPLSERGRLQAASLAEQLASERVDVLISSDLKRAVETAEILGRRWGLRPRLDGRLRELDIGDWTGLTREQIELRAGDRLARFEAEEVDLRPGGGETRREIRNRVRTVVPALAEIWKGHRVAIVTHLGVIRALVPGSEPSNAGCVRINLHEIPGYTPPTA